MRRGSFERHWNSFWRSNYCNSVRSMSFLEIWHGIDPWPASGLYIIQVASALVSVLPSILWKNTMQQEKVTHLYVFKPRRSIPFRKKNFLYSEKMPLHWEGRKIIKKKNQNNFEQKGVGILFDFLLLQQTKNMKATKTTTVAFNPLWLTTFNPLEI